MTTEPTMDTTDWTIGIEVGNAEVTGNWDIVRALCAKRTIKMAEKEERVTGEIEPTHYTKYGAFFSPI